MAVKHVVTQEKGVSITPANPLKRRDAVVLA